MFTVTVFPLADNVALNGPLTMTVPLLNSFSVSPALACTNTSKPHVVSVNVNAGKGVNVGLSACAPGTISPAVKPEPHPRRDD